MTTNITIPAHLAPEIREHLETLIARHAERVYDVASIETRGEYMPGDLAFVRSRAVAANNAIILFVASLAERGLI